MKFLVFDMDGVLVDSTPCHDRAYRDLWRHYGVAGPEYSAIAGRPTREVVAAYTADIDEWAAYKQQRARQYLITEPVMFADVLPCLEALHVSGVRMGVATGASRANAELLLDRAGIAGFFQFVLTAEDISRGKPDPEIYRRAAELAGQDTLVVEDSAAGLAAAAAASASVACVRTGLSHPSPFFLGSYPDLTTLTRTLGVEV